MDPAPEPTPRARALAPGTRLGRYTIQRRLATGGMAELYLARASGIRGFEKLVVLKLVLPHLADDPEFVGMFLDEARIAATLDHPNIAHVMDIGRVGDDHFFAMEYVHGEDVRAILRDAAPKGGVPLATAIAIILGAAAGLHYAHERVGPDGRRLGLVHRDVSPSNVIVTFDGGVKVVDFGIARAETRSKATRAGLLKGKAGYMSPEQCRGDAVDRRSDVFGLGILLWELTTGMRLFHGEHDYAVMSKIVFGVVPDPRRMVAGYPADLAEIVRKALRRDPAERHETAHALLLDLEGFAHAHNLRTSAVVLERTMLELFGRRPYPPMEAPTGDGDDEPGEAPAPAAPSIDRVARSPRWPLAVGLGAAGLIAIAWGATRLVSDGEPHEQTQPQGATVANDSPIEPPPQPSSAATAIPEEDAGADDDEPILLDDDGDDPARPHVRAGKKKRKDGERARPALPDRPNELFPPTK